MSRKCVECVRKVCEKGVWSVPKKCVECDINSASQACLDERLLISNARAIAYELQKTQNLYSKVKYSKVKYSKVNE